MKSKKTNKTTVILSIVLSFFLGRESKGFNGDYKSSHNKQEQYEPYALDAHTNFNEDTLILREKETDTVYRCGQSKIYHPTTSHSSFKRCKSKVYNLTVKRAKNLGMRHCKCSG